MYKIMDFEKKGNLVRFYLGNLDVMDYWGDDWNDTPYEHNAGEVYDEYTEGYIDVAFPFDWLVLEPRDDWRNQGNSRWCKEDMKNRRVPCIVAVPSELAEKTYDDGFNSWVCADGAFKFYFEDKVDEKLGEFIVFDEGRKLVR